MMLGQYAGYIIAAYAITGAVIIGLIAWTNLAHGARRRELAALESQGVQRRSKGQANG
jgi:heme exporter protein CcmD